jgi:hypothetical protein
MLFFEQNFKQSKKKFQKSNKIFLRQKQEKQKIYIGDLCTVHLFPKENLKKNS